MGQFFRTWVLQQAARPVAGREKSSLPPTFFSPATWDRSRSIVRIKLSYQLVRGFMTSNTIPPTSAKAPATGGMK